MYTEAVSVVIWIKCKHPRKSEKFVYVDFHCYEMFGYRQVLCKRSIRIFGVKKTNGKFVKFRKVTSRFGSDVVSPTCANCRIKNIIINTQSHTAMNFACCAACRNPSGLRRGAKPNFPSLFPFIKR